MKRFQSYITEIDSAKPDPDDIIKKMKEIKGGNPDDVDKLMNQNFDAYNDAVDPIKPEYRKYKSPQDLKNAMDKLDKQRSASPSHRPPGTPKPGNLADVDFFTPEDEAMLKKINQDIEDARGAADIEIENKSASKMDKINNPPKPKGASGKQHDWVQDLIQKNDKQRLADRQVASGSISKYETIDDVLKKNIMKAEKKYDKMLAAADIAPEASPQINKGQKFSKYMKPANTYASAETIMDPVNRATRTAGSRASNVVGQVTKFVSKVPGIGLAAKGLGAAGMVATPLAIAADAETHADIVTKREFDDIAAAKQRGENPYSAKGTTARAIRQLSRRGSKFHD